MIRSEQEKIMYRGLFTHGQAALYLGVSKDKMRILIERGLIGESAPNRIAKAEIDRYLLEQAEIQRHLVLMKRER